MGLWSKRTFGMGLGASVKARYGEVSKLALKDNTRETAVESGEVSRSAESLKGRREITVIPHALAREDSRGLW
jgi:hypothetical protein